MHFLLCHCLLGRFVQNQWWLSFQSQLLFKQAHVYLPSFIDQKYKGSTLSLRFSSLLLPIISYIDLSLFLGDVPTLCQLKGNRMPPLTGILYLGKPCIPD